MFKKILALLLTFSTVISVEKGFQGATMVVRNIDSLQSQKSQTYHLKPVSYASIYPVKNQQIVKIIRPEGNNGCKSFQKIISDQNRQVFYLIDGHDGRCSFNKRVHNAKKSSANGLIIVNSAQGTSNLNLMSNKDYFQVFLLQQNEGSQILALKSPFLAQINIKKVKDQVSKAQIWISSLNSKSYDIVSWWANNLKKITALQTKVTWQPRFAYISCRLIGNSNFCGGDTSSCACGGMFCSPEKHGKTSNVLVREDIRQSLIYKQGSDKFLTYISQFKQKCLDKYIAQSYVEDCSNSLLQHLEIQSAALNQKIDRLLFSCQNLQIQNTQSDLLKEMVLDEGRFTQLSNYPTITLNHQILQFKNQNQLKDQLCRKLALQKEKGCSIQNTTIVVENQSLWGTLLWIIFVVLLVVITVFAVYKFKNKLRHQMNKQLKMQVSTAVEHYFSLTQTNQS